ncbi:MAG: hypothetical protein AAGA09_02180 [Pseudomonadota bacterium]
MSDHIAFSDGAFRNRAFRNAGVRGVALGVLTLLGAVFSASSAPAYAEDDKTANHVAGYQKTGDEVSCLRLSMVRDTDPLDDTMILFEVRGGAMFVNELNGRCVGLERERRFSLRTPQNQMCEGDIINVTDNFGNFRGSCSLGAFQALMDMPEEDV